jgi:hypothetical protein
MKPTTLTETDFSTVKLSVISIFEENFQIACHLELFSRLFFQKIEPEIQLTRTTLSQKVYLKKFKSFATFCINIRA